jgi:uncharacterized protein (DUF983 family)
VAISVWHVAVRGVCPRCGRAPLFCGLLKVVPRCEACGLDLAQVDVGDGLATPVILVLGAVLCGLAIWTDVKFNPPWWLHVILWPALGVPAGLGLMRWGKAALIALQYRTRWQENGH